MPVHIPLPSLEALTDPAELSRLLERPVTTVTAVPVDDAQTSTEARFQRLTLDDGSAPGLFVKIVDPAQDWVAYVTADDRRRAVALWSEGLFERMPSEADAAVLACAEWEDGYAVLMPDLGAQLPVSGAVLAPAGFDALLEAMAAMHAAFWGDASLDDPHLGLCAPEAFLSHTSPGRAARHRKQHDSWIFGVVEEGWDALPTFMDAGLVAELRALNDDPAPILRALEACPRTLVHSDIRPANFAIGQSNGAHSVAFIDWGRPLAGAASLDLGYLLGWTVFERPYPVDEVIANYEDALQRRLPTRLDAAWWERVRDVGILGGLLNTICFHALGARGEDEAAATEASTLGWWQPRMRRALSYL